MKRFVVCLDGTWNNAASEKERRGGGGKVYRPTNVLKLARATTQVDDEGTLQITYYDAGVGAMNRAPNLRTKVVRFFDNKLGGGWGAGFEVNVEESYTFLANNYSAGDEVFIFGFSRGASQARSLVRLIEWAGGFPTKNDVYYVPSLVTRFLERRGEGSGQELWDERNQRRAAEGRALLEPLVPARIQFLGVWDTVLALGTRLAARGGSSGKKHRFHTPSEPPAIVDRCRHALAIDERRHDFQPEIWDTHGADDACEQRWFPGVHSNVGGGLSTDGLANGALIWICKEARAAGLGLRDDFLRFYCNNACDEASGKSGFYVFGDFMMRPVRGFGGVRDLGARPGMTLDDTVFERLNDERKKLETPYRPDNLLKFLVANPEYDERLSAEVRALVQKMR